MKSLAKYSVFLTLLGLGCQPTPTPQTYDGQGKPIESATKPGKPEQVVAKPKPSDLPASLKTEAWDYFGCGNEKTMDVELRVKNSPTLTGGIAMNLESIKDGKALYKIARTGAIADSLGDETVEVDETGIYTIANTAAIITPTRNLTLPTDLTPGKTWPSKTKVVRDNGQELEENSVFKVVGVQEVTTKVAKQAALLVTSTGTALVTIDGKKVSAKYDTKSWYVKGKGPVKLEISLVIPGKPVNSVVVEETK